MLLAVNKAQLPPAPGWETRNIPGSGDFWDKDLPSSSHPTERTRWGRGRTEDTWFVVWFKEHLNLSKDLGPGVAGGAAGSARTRHGRFLCAFLKGRGGRTQPALASPGKPQRSQGWELPRRAASSQFPLLPKGMEERRKGHKQGSSSRSLRGRGLAQARHVLPPAPGIARGTIQSQLQGKGLSLNYSKWWR